MKVVCVNKFSSSTVTSLTIKLEKLESYVSNYPVYRKIVKL